VCARACVCVCNERSDERNDKRARQGWRVSARYREALLPSFPSSASTATDAPSAGRLSALKGGGNRAKGGWPRLRKGDLADDPFRFSLSLSLSLSLSFHLGGPFLGARHPAVSRNCIDCLTGRHHDRPLRERCTGRLASPFSTSRLPFDGRGTG